MPKRKAEQEAIEDDEEIPVEMSEEEKCKKAVRLMNGRRKLSQKEAAKKVGISVSKLQR